MARKKDTNKDQVEKLLQDGIQAVKTEKLCVTCNNSYFRPGSYDGYCKFTSVVVYMQPKIIGVFDTCENWRKKQEKKKTT